MAKEKEKKEREGSGARKPEKRKHLHEIRTTQAEDGSYVHHHTYKAKREDHMTEPERQNAATSETPEEAGDHVREQFAMNDQPEEQEGGGEDEGAGEAEGEGEGEGEGEEE